jgi:hypothetical protein
MYYPKCDCVVDGKRHKMIVCISGIVPTWLKIKPKNVPPGVHASGVHFIFNDPNRSHWDHQIAASGLPPITWKDYENKPRPEDVSKVKTIDKLEVD